MTRRWKENFFASMVASHGRQLMRFFVSRVPNPSDAQDLVQEVYLRLLRLERPELIRSPEAYLFTIAANIAREFSLKKSAGPLHIALEDTPVEALPADVEWFEAAAPEQAALQQDRVKQLEKVLAGLSPKARATLIWHRRDGLTYKEIGAKLNISTNMVKKYLSQALAHCRNHMELEEGNS